MSGFKVKMDIPEMHFKQKEFSAYFRSEMQIQMRQAARAFLRAVIKRVPVDTGEARGTLLPLGRFLNVAVPISPKRSENNKDAGTGEMNSPLIFDFESEDTGEYFTIEALQLFHYIWNEFYAHNYSNPQIEPPWHSIQDGVDAFMEYLKTYGIKRLPKMKDFIDVTRIVVNGNSKIRMPGRKIN